MVHIVKDRSRAVARARERKRERDSTSAVLHSQHRKMSYALQSKVVTTLCLPLLSA